MSRMTGGTHRRANWTARVLCLTVILGGCIGCDRATKQLASARLSGTGAHSFLGDCVRIQYAENPGAFLGLGGKLSARTRFWLLVVLNVLFLSVLAGALILRWDMPAARFAALSLLLAGGIGNLIDRIARDGLVIDFLNLGVGPLRTGIFNVADVAITVGAVALFFEFRKPSGAQEVSASPG